MKSVAAVPDLTGAVAALVAQRCPPVPAPVLVEKREPFVRPSTGAVMAVARCADCGIEIGQVPVSNWERLHLPTNPWAQLVALASAHKLGCRPLAVLPADATASERMRTIEAWSRRCSRDSGGLMALGDAVRKLLPPGSGVGA